MLDILLSQEYRLSLAQGTRTSSSIYYKEGEEREECIYILRI